MQDQVAARCCAEAEAALGGREKTAGICASGRRTKALLEIGDDLWPATAVNAQHQKPLMNQIVPVRKMCISVIVKVESGERGTGRACLPERDSRYCSERTR